MYKESNRPSYHIPFHPYHAWCNFFPTEVNQLINLRTKQPFLETSIPKLPPTYHRLFCCTLQSSSLQYSNCIKRIGSLDGKISTQYLVTSIPLPILFPIILPGFIARAEAGSPQQKLNFKLYYILLLFSLHPVRKSSRRHFAVLQ